MKLRATLSFEYEMDDRDLLPNYGTTDPIECAKIDQTSMEDDPVSFLHFDADIKVTVEVVEA